MATREELHRLVEDLADALSARQGDELRGMLAALLNATTSPEGGRYPWIQGLDVKPEIGGVSRDHLHRLVDALPEARWIQAALDLARDDDEPLDAEDLAAIAQGEVDHLAGRTVPLEQVRAELRAEQQASRAAG